MCASTGDETEYRVPRDEQEMKDLIEKLDVKLLRWADIPFSSIEEELRAIDDYEKEEGLAEANVWPKFLRGAAYEYWGQPQLALAQYAKTDQGAGLRQVPELWERRAYNSFKVGKIGHANAYFDVALRLFQDSCGNELHFVHWFYTNFQDYVPKWNGPPAAIQRGICKYCIGDVKEARENFIPEIFLKNDDVEHAILWLLACSAKVKKEDGLVITRDLKVVREALEYDIEWNPRLRLLIDLFFAHGEGFMSHVSDAEGKLADAIKGDESDDVTTFLYLALYHDAFTGDEEERDRALDTTIAIGSTAFPNDMENFLFCAAKNRLTAPPDAKATEITEHTS